MWKISPRRDVRKIHSVKKNDMYVVRCLVVEKLRIGRS